MKKVLILMTSAILLFTGCQKNEAVQQLQSNGGDENVTFTVAVPDVMTKALADNDGHGANVNHWIMEVRDVDGDIFSRKEDDGTKGELTHTFNVTLIKGQTYNVLFWADTKGFYKTDSLTNVKLPDLSGHTANRDSLDAFSAVEANFTTTTATTKPITLKRPFAQLNVIFTDLDTLYKTINNDTEYAKFKPYNFKAVAKIPTSFNVLTQAAGDPAATALTMTAATNYKDNYSAHAAEATLYMDYLFATADSKDIVDIDFSFVSKDSTISHSFASIPFQRNYRTNIKGKLMTSGATFNVTVDPEWDGEIDIPYAATGSIQAANDSLAAGKTTINLVNPGDVDTTSVKFPSATDTKDVSINISGTTGKTITFEYESGAQGPANIYINTDCENLDIDTPNSHVVVNGGDYTAVEAATSATTLVIGKDVTVDDLTVTEGNIEIHGLVKSITKPQQSVVTYVIETAEVLRDVAAKINATAQGVAFPAISFAADIDLKNEEWTPINGWFKSLKIDGKNHTVKNLKISQSTGSYIGFVDVATDITIKNLKFDGANLSYPEASGTQARGGVVAGQIYGSLVENCHVKNATIAACQKVGGLIGFLEGNSNTPYVVKDCSVEKITIKSNKQGQTLEHGAGGFIGHISLSNNPLITITGCSAKDITIQDFPTTYSLQLYAGLFIGNACTSHQGTEVSDITSHSIVLSNNTVSGTNTVLPTSIYSSEYFAWAGNAEERPAWKGNIYIDGQKWTPDYSFECGGVKYATLDAALAKVSESQDKTVRIIKAGEYKVESLNASNCTVEATVEGVVFNHTPGSHARITGDSNENVTVKNVTWNVGVATYQYYSGTNLENCTVNGIICTRTEATFKNCKFVNETDYNFWIYGTDATFEGCEFTCPGGTKGGALNLYHENNPKVTKVIVKDCEFTALESTTKYSALYIKPEVPFDVEITNCTANDKFVNGAISGSKLWNVKSNDNLNTTVKVDGKLVYANGAVLAISTPAQLQALAASVNAGSTFSGMTITLDADVDLQGIDWTPIGNVDKNFWGTFDGQGHTISNLTINNTATTENVTTGLFGWINTATIKNVNIDGAQISGHHDVGAIAGYMEANSTCTISGCNVTNAQISCTYGSSDADGDKCGGIVGYAGNSGSYVTNCTVTNTTISAGRDAGQVAGAGKTAQVTGCSATNVTVTDNKTGTGDNIRNEIIGRVL